MRVFTCSTLVVSEMSWKLSLSPVTISHSQPAASQRADIEPSRSSASQPSASTRFIFIASSACFKSGICTASSSGIGLRWAL